MRLIHFGSTNYQPEKFNPISDRLFWNKPNGGLWTSPVNSKYGWKQWCKDESFCLSNLTKYFEIEFTGTILKINSISDMEKLPWVELQGKHFVSFQSLCPIKFFYDAIHLTVRGLAVTRHKLYGWDCETVLVMNPASIKTT